MQEEAAEATNQARLFLEQAAKRRKKKKKMEKRVPRTSSHSSCGRARRRQLQRHVRTAGFPGDDLPRAVLPSSVGLPELPGILVGVFQKDSVVCFVDSGSGMSQAGFAVISPRAVFLSIVAWPLCSASWAVWTRRTVAVAFTRLVWTVTWCSCSTSRPLCTRRTVATWCSCSTAENFGLSAVAVRPGRRHLFRPAEADPHGPGLSEDH